MKASPQLNLPPQQVDALRKRIATDESVEHAKGLAARFLREALDRWGERKVAASHMRVSEAQLSKWVNGAEPFPAYRLELMPPTFHEIHTRLKNQYYGLTQLRLAQLISIVGNLDGAEEFRRAANE